jgi:hypothetical protein
MELDSDQHQDWRGMVREAVGVDPAWLRDVLRAVRAAT